MKEKGTLYTISLTLCTYTHTLYKSFSYTPYIQKQIYSLNNSICYLKGYKYQHIMQTHYEIHTTAFYLLK